MEIPNTDILLEKLVEWNHHDDKDHKHIREIEKELCIEYISVSVEKHHELQYTYYFEVDYGSEITNEIFFVEIENGINNGTQINHAEWGSDTKPESKTVDILKDVVFNEVEFEVWCDRNNISENEKPNLLNLAKSLLERHKEQLMTANRNQSYDNYVTGGGTLKTNQHYKDLYQKLSDKGVFWSFVYEEIEVDVNFI